MLNLLVNSLDLNRLPTKASLIRLEFFESCQLTTKHQDIFPNRGNRFFVTFPTRSAYKTILG